MIRVIGAFALIAVGCGSQAPPVATPPPAVELGRELAVQRACASCHSADGSARVGPTWKGLYGSTVTLEDGSTVRADDDYLRESIGDPDARIVRGYAAGVMSNVIKPGSIPAEELDALVAYIRSLQ